MPRKGYLSHEQRRRFDSPPSLTNAQRAVFIQLPEWAEQFYATLPTPTSRAGFLLQLGYFRIVCRFFEPRQFRQGGIGFIQKSGKNIDPNRVDMAACQQSSSCCRHQGETLSRLGFEPFATRHQRSLLEEAKRLAHLQVTPEGIIDSCVAYLRADEWRHPPTVVFVASSIPPCRNISLIWNKSWKSTFMPPTGPCSMTCSANRAASSNTS